MPSTVTLKGSPLHLEGTEIHVGDKAPDFRARRSLGEDASLKDYAGKTVLLSVVPSLDTPVCDLQARRFNEEAGKFGDKVAIVVISADLPPAQARWCGAADAKNLITLSDYMHHDFGRKYGVFIKELGILARAVFVIGPDGKVKYAEYVPEIAQHPNYDAALAAAAG
jgi:thiol peroxidase